MQNFVWLLYFFNLYERVFTENKIYVNITSV